MDDIAAFNRRLTQLEFANQRQDNHLNQTLEKHYMKLATFNEKMGVMEEDTHRAKTISANTEKQMEAFDDAQGDFNKKM